MGGVEEIDGHDMAGNAYNIGLPNGGKQGLPVEGQLNGFPGVRQVFGGIDGGVTLGLDT